MKAHRFGLACALAMFLAACGGGGSSGGSNPPPLPPAPSGLSYPSPHIFTIGTAISTITPTVTGAPTSYSASPALPAGLALNATSGAISGAPTAPQAATSHTVTASNAGGNTTAALSITVQDVAPSVIYPQATYSFATEVAITAVIPATTGGAVVSWSIAPALPAGLTLNTTNGQISGTPTAASTATQYVVTATNSGGADTFDITIAVQSAVLFDLVHAARIRAIHFSGTRFVTMDANGRVVLWNSQNNQRLFTGQSDCVESCDAPSALAGQTLVVRRANGFDIHDAGDGTLVTHIDVPTTSGALWRLATDGSYIVHFSPAGLSVWSTAGALMHTRTGNYDNARLFAAPGEIRTPRALAIEKITLPAGTTSSTSAFIGSFAAWFGDGERFLTNVGNTVTIYSHQAVQQDIVALPSIGGLAGFGNWFWFQTPQSPSEVRIYEVGASTMPAASYAIGSKLMQSGNMLGMVSEADSTLSIVDLSGATPTRTVQSVPQTAARVSTLGEPFAARSPDEWLLGNDGGAVFAKRGTIPAQLVSYGRATHIAGSLSRVAAATSSGVILTFALPSRALESEIPFGADQLKMSADGTVLAAAAQYGSFANSDRTIKVFSLPAGSVTAEWPAVYGQPSSMHPFNFDLSANGTVLLRSLAQGSGTPTNPSHYLTRLDNPPPLSDVLLNLQEPLLRLSPSGSLIAAGSTTVYNFFPALTSTINIYSNGTLTSAAAGWPVAWIDDSRLFVNRHRDPRGVTDYEFSQIVSSAGALLKSIPDDTFGFRDPLDIQSLGGNQIYVPGMNSIVDLDTETVVWSTTTPHISYPIAGAVAGDAVYFMSGSTIRAEPR